MTPTCGLLQGPIETLNDPNTPMKPRTCLSSPRFRLLAPCLATLAALLRTMPAVAQVVPAANPPAITVQQLVKYDKNKNGVLDPDELAAMQADEAKIAGAVAAGPATGKE